MQLKTQTPFQAAITEFNRARSRAAVERLLSRLTGRSADLLAFDDVIDRLRLAQSAARGVRQIPIDAIIGSVGRYNDFSRTFLPLDPSDRHRWASVRAAATHVSDLPPIEVYQVGDHYFVLDGNHRVSIARLADVDFIDARVTEVVTRVPFDPDDDPTELIVKEEYAGFLAATNLDRLRPDVNLWVSVPGQYDHLENHIEANRFLVEAAENRRLTWPEAVTHWYDQMYLPFAAEIHAQGILRYFPQRTVTDLYVWLVRHAATLRRELGWQVAPDKAVPALLGQLAPEARPTRWGGRLLGRRFGDEHDTPPPLPPKRTWSETRLMARYGDRLFQDILLLLPTADPGGPAWEQAVMLCGYEQSRLLALSEQPVAPDQAQRFQTACRAVACEGFLASAASETLLDALAQRAAYADLLLAAVDGLDITAWPAAIGRVSRPVLLVSTPTALVKPLLLYEDREADREALFVATYLAERWGSALTVQVPPSVTPDALRHLHRYCELHELQPEFVTAAADSASGILTIAAAHACDAIITTAVGPAAAGLSAATPHRPARRLHAMLTSTPLPLLVCH